MRLGLFTILGVVFYLSWFGAFAAETSKSMEFKKVDMRNFTVDYRSGLGSAAFEYLDVKVGDFGLTFKDYQVDIKKDQGQILFAKEDTSLLVDKIQGSVLDSVSVLALHNASLLVDPEVALKFHMDGGEFEMGNGIQSLGPLSLECKSERGRNGNIMSFIRPCFKLGRLAIPELTISELSKDTLGNFFPVDEIEEADLSEQVRKLKGPDKLKDINLMVYNNKYTLSLKTKFIVKLKLKIEGNAIYQEEQNRIVFSVDKAKVGWFSVKKLVMKEIKKAGIKNVQVFGYNVIINL